MAFKRILVAVDDSSISAHAADVGFDLARAVQGDVALITVVDPSLYAAPDSGVPAANIVRFGEDDARRLLADIAARGGIQPPPRAFVPVGRPGAEIVNAARDWPADVIVIGSHGRGGVGRLVLGSVAEAVMRQAPCPVLVVRSRS